MGALLHGFRDQLQTRHEESEMVFSIWPVQDKS